MKVAHDAVADHPMLQCTPTSCLSVEELVCRKSGRLVALALLLAASCASDNIAENGDAIPPGNIANNCPSIDGKYRYTGSMTSWVGQNWSDDGRIGRPLTFVSAIAAPVYALGPPPPRSEHLATMRVAIDATTNTLTVSPVGPMVNDRPELFRLPMACIDGEWMGRSTASGTNFAYELSRSLRLSPNNDLIARIQYSGWDRNLWLAPRRKRSYTTEAVFLSN